MSVYKLENEDGLVYIGATKNSLNKRLNNHQSYARTNKVKCRSVLLFENDKKVTISLLEEVDDLKDLNVRERYHIENTECVNYHIPTRTPTEWRNDNIDIIKPKQNEYSKKYYLENKERILKRMKDKYNNSKCL